MLTRAVSPGVTMPSIRAEQNELRGEMRAAGMGIDVTAAEFARRYGLRPRAAWRYAHGWTLTRAAGHINECADTAGLHPSGDTVAMSSSRLCEIEGWPGEGHRPTGRKPTPYVLALLGRTYGAGIADLLDLRDYERLSPADRLIIEVCDPATYPYVHDRPTVNADSRRPRNRAALSPRRGTGRHPMIQAYAPQPANPVD